MSDKAAIDWSSAGGDEMLAHLDEMDRVAFEAACMNDAFTEDHVRVLLKNPALPSELIERVSREARFFKRGLIRFELVCHKQLPRVRALEMVPHLFWRDSLRVATSLKVHPHVRLVAEQQVAMRVADLTPGERISIARSATRVIFQALREDQDPRVVTALLQNFRCTEEDVLLIVNSKNVSPHVLALVARHGKWRKRPAIRSVLVRSTRLGLPLALGFLEFMTPAELKGIALQRTLPKLLRESARRLHEESRRRG